MVTMTFTIPDDLARAVAEAGLLNDETFADALRSMLRQQAMSKLTEVMNELSALDVPPMTFEEIEEEIQAANAQRRAVGASDA